MGVCCFAHCCMRTITCFVWPFNTDSSKRLSHDLCVHKSRCFSHKNIVTNSAFSAIFFSFTLSTKSSLTWFRSEIVVWIYSHIGSDILIYEQRLVTKKFAWKLNSEYNAKNKEKTIYMKVGARIRFSSLWILILHRIELFTTRFLTVLRQFEYDKTVIKRFLRNCSCFPNQSNEIMYSLTWSPLEKTVFSTDSRH